MSATGRSTMHGELIALAAASEIDGNGRQWIEVMPTATEARNGRFYFTVTADDLATYAESIQANAERIMVDRDHEGAVGGSTKAAGWFTGETEITDDAERGPILRARVQWTPTAVQEINDGEFRFISPEFGFEDKNAKTGLMTKAKDFVAATLTNRPFFSELAALAADAGVVLWSDDDGVNALQSKLAEALNPGASTYDDTRFWVLDVDIVNQRARVCASGPGDEAWIVPYQRDENGNVTVPPTVDWIPIAQAWVADNDQDDAPMSTLAHRLRATAAHIDEQITTHGGSAATTQEDHMSEELKALAADLGLPEDATSDQITDAVKTAKATADRVTELEQELATAKAAASGGGEDEVALLKQANQTLTSRLENLETTLTARETTEATARKDTVIAEALGDGRIPSAERDDWRAKLDVNEELTTSILAALPKGRVPVTDRVVAGAVAAQNHLDTVRAHLGLNATATV